jgi:hypothetical protein
MTTREQRMSIALIGFITVAGLGFVGYQFILAPLQAKQTLINNLNNDIEDKEARVARVLKRKADLDAWSKLSLPPDPVDPNKPPPPPPAPGKAAEPVQAVLARREYEEFLSKLASAAGFDAGSITIIPKPPDAKSVPLFATRRPIYTKLLFSVEVRGDLASVVDFMVRFYKVRLLHQVRKLVLAKPAGGGFGGPPTTDLVATLDIEALVLDTAEKRTALQPNPSVGAQVLARDEHDYARIAGKNIFFGPPAPVQRESGPGYFDATPFIRLTGISSHPNGMEATLWDTYNNREYRVTPRSLGGFQIDAMFTVNGRRHTDPDRSGKALTLRDTDGTVMEEWQFVRIDPREVILRDDRGTYAVLHLGEYMNKRTELKKADLDALGIKPEPPKEKPKPTEFDKDDP